MKPLSELTIFITGATDGLGKMTAERLARKGARVLLHGRNKSKGASVVAEMKRSTGNDKLEYYNADFSSLQNIAVLGEELRSRYTHLDVLINNAAIGGGPKSPANRELSKDGFELRFAINYLAQVLMTKQILPLLRNKGCRIINVASIGQAPLDYDDLMMERHYDSHRAYSQSKLALIMFTFDLAAELKKSGITVNALHPATLMNTNLVVDHFDRILSTVEEGCDALEYLTVSDELDHVTGEYFNGTSQSKALPQAYELNARAKLKAITEKLLSQSV